MMRYRVKRAYGRGAEAECAQFKEVADATCFIQVKREQDKQLNVNVTYRLYDMDELLPDDSGVDKTTASPQENAAGSQGKGSSATFKPTPFNMTPRPAGSPQKWIHDADEDKDEKK